MRSRGSPAFRARNARPLRIGMVVAGVIMVMVGAELSNELMDFLDHGRGGATGLVPLFHGLWGLTVAQYASGGLIFILFGVGAMLFVRGRSLGTSTAEEWVDEQRQAEALAREQAAVVAATPAAAGRKAQLWSSLACRA